MNTEIRKIIEKIESDQQELERLVQERTVIMKNERHLSTGNFRREVAIIENFIRRKSEEIMNERKTVEDYTKASDLMRELAIAPGSEEERAEKEEELSSVMESLPAELQQELIDRANNRPVEENNVSNNEPVEENTSQNVTSNEERLRTLQDALEVARNAYQASIDNFQTIFANERNEIAERGPITNEELDELNSRYLSAKEEENERLQRNRDLITEIESRINDLNATIEQERREQEITPAVETQQDSSAPENTPENNNSEAGQTSSEENNQVSNPDDLSKLKNELLNKVRAGEMSPNEMIRRVQEAAGNSRKQEENKESKENEGNNENKEYSPIPKDKALVPSFGKLKPVVPIDSSKIKEKDNNKNKESSDNKEEEYKPIPKDKALVPVPEPDNEYKPIPKDKALVPVPEPDNEYKPIPEPNKEAEEKSPRGFYTIINELTEGLNVQAKTGKRYKVSNIKVSKEFKEELKSGNYLYNIVHLVPAIIKVPIKLIRKAFNRFRYSYAEHKTVATLKERISNLNEDDLKIIWDEYRGTKVIGERYPDILNILLNERMQRYAMEKVTSLNSSMEAKYKELFDAKQTVDKCNEILSKANTEGNKELVQQVIETRENALNGKAEMIKKLREEYKEANQWLSGGAHGFEEDIKAATTRLSIVGKRFAKERNLDPEITKRQAEIEQKEMNAIRNNDDESALNAFIENEVLLSSNTEFERSIFGNRSSGAKYYEPTIVKSDYRDDPFIRDLFTTVATTGAVISTISAINVHGSQADEMLKEHQNEVSQANANNDAIIDNVNEQGAKLVDNSNDFAEGMQAQAEANVVNYTNTMERQTLDQTSWQVGSSSYRAADAAAHEAYNSMADSVQSRISDVASQYSSGIISKEATLDMLKDISNETQQNLAELYASYLPTLKEYAASHPQFDLHGVEEAMGFVTSHPGAIAKMNEGMVESVQIGENLQALSAEHIQAINSLPSDLRTTLFADGAAAVALAYTVARDMDKNVASGKYGNEVTNMVSEYIANKESANTETNTSSKNK
ncbi:MAG: hypothetical protein SOV80_06500 [Bacilli bacterium]|nr:hypothetical protein [bacterium]MDY2697846.1 hypothetical protein [Bacilli bacterium]